MTSLFWKGLGREGEHGPLNGHLGKKKYNPAKNQQLLIIWMHSTREQNIFKS